MYVNSYFQNENHKLNKAYPTFLIACLIDVLQRLKQRRVSTGLLLQFKLVLLNSA